MGSVLASHSWLPAYARPWSSSTSGITLPAQRARGTAKARQGWEHLDRGAYAVAERAFTQAARLLPGEPSILVGLGLSYKLMGKHDRAVQTLQRAIRLDASLERAHGLLGDLYVRRGDFERAIHHYRIARKQDPEDLSLRDRHRRARIQYRAELEFDRLFSPHFLVKYRASNTDPQYVHRVVDRLEEVYTTIGRRLAYFPQEAFPVILYPGEEFWEATASPDWARAMFDGTIHLPARDAAPEGAMPDSLLRHEMAHALVDHLSAGRVPVWLSEGLALYFEGGRATVLPSAPVQRGEAAISLQTLRGEFLSLPPEAARQAYARSHSATVNLIERHGLKGMRAFLEALSENADFPHAFQTVFHTPFLDFESRWLTFEPERRF